MLHTYNVALLVYLSICKYGTARIVYVDDILVSYSIEAKTVFSKKDKHP